MSKKKLKKQLKQTKKDLELLTGKVDDIWKYIGGEINLLWARMDSNSHRIGTLESKKPKFGPITAGTTPNGPDSSGTYVTPPFTHTCESEQSNSST